MLFLDGETYEVLWHRPIRFTEFRWSPRASEPHLMYWVDGSRIGAWDVQADQTTVLATFTGYDNLQFGPWEGNLSNDGRWVALNGRQADGRRVGFAYDLVQETKHPDLDLSGWRDLDWISVSPLGTYLVVHGTRGRSNQTRVHTLDGGLVQFWQKSGRLYHLDLTVDPDGGAEVAVGVLARGAGEGEVHKRRLDTGQITRLTFDGSYASHVSTRNLNRPGWAYVTYEFNWGGAYRREIVALKLDTTVGERFVQTRNRRNANYYSEAHGSPSPDGQRVIWASTWGPADRPIQAYVGDVRARR